MATFRLMSLEIFPGSLSSIMCRVFLHGNRTLDIKKRAAHQVMTARKAVLGEKHVVFRKRPEEPVRV